MKVDIKPVEKSKGMVFKKTLHGVELSVQFSSEELAIIEERKLARTILLERGAPADVNAEKHENRGVARVLATAVVSGRDANHFHLTFGKLMNGSDTYFFDTPVEAKMYIDELKTEILPLAKNYLEGNKETANSDSFEL